MTAIATGKPGRLEYSAAAKLLHWATAIIIFGMIPLGFLLEDLPEGRIQNLGYDVHRSFGFVVLCLALLRLLLRAVFGAPEPYAGLTPFERQASWFVHRALYVLLIVTPLLGWAATSAYPATISVFWLFTLPSIAPESEALSKLLFRVHGVAALTLLALVTIHVAGALMHRVVKRDGVLDRMLPRRKV